jgi:hypothetical protein
MLSKKSHLAGSRRDQGLDIMMREAITLKFIAAALTGDQLKELIQIPPRRQGRAATSPWPSPWRLEVRRLRRDLVAIEAEHEEANGR